MASAANGASRMSTEMRLLSFTKKGPSMPQQEKSPFSLKSHQRKQGRKGRAYRRFVFVELDGEEGIGRLWYHRPLSSWETPAYIVDVVEAVNHVSCLYQLCVAHQAVLILPSLFYIKKKEKKEHTEKDKQFCSRPLIKVVHK